MGVELASIFSELGVRVTILEKLPRILDLLDEEVVQLFTRVLHRRGVEVKTRAEVRAIEEGQMGLRVIWDGPEGERGSEGQAVLAATGRLPYTAGLGLEDLGLRLEEKAIAVNENLETSVEGLYAAGDVLGRYMLAHVAFHEGEVVAENALGRPRRVDYRVIPTCVFAQPELASVGLTEREARDGGIPYRVSRFPFAACGRAMTMGEPQGLVKLLCHAEGGQLLGMHVMGPHASDLIAEGVLAIKLGATAKDVADTIHAHPTLPETVREAALGLLEGAIHFHGRRG